jgi:hypothetical protein
MVLSRKDDTVSVHDPAVELSYGEEGVKLFPVPVCACIDGADNEGIGSEEIKEVLFFPLNFDRADLRSLHWLQHIPFLYRTAILYEPVAIIISIRNA